LAAVSYFGFVRILDGTAARLASLAFALKLGAQATLGTGLAVELAGSIFAAFDLSRFAALIGGTRDITVINQWTKDYLAFASLLGGTRNVTSEVLRAINNIT
jgi:hypothetical protein